MGLFYLAYFFIVNSLGTICPVYLSYKALKNNDIQSLEVLLMFWIVMGVITALENTVGWLVNWIPFFYQFKCGFMLWLTLPQSQGSTHIYVTYVHPFLLKHEDAIDRGVSELKITVHRAAEEIFYQTFEKVKAITAGFFASAYAAQQQSTLSNVSPPGSQDAHGASSYASNFFQQIVPTASAFFEATKPSSAASGPPPRSLGPNSQGGYQIPEYDDLPARVSTGIASRKDNIRNESVLQSRKSSGGLPGYDEIGSEEASGSEADWATKNNNNNNNPSGTGPRPRIPSSRSSSQQTHFLGGNHGNGSDEKLRTGSLERKNPPIEASRSSWLRWGK